MDYFRHEQAIVADGAQIGAETRVWAFSNIQKGALIGKACNICDGCFVENGAVIGDHVTIKNNVALFDGVTLEDNVFVGAFTAFINDRYPRSTPDNKWTLERTWVKKGATLGANATILCGVTIGEYAVVGAGAVVTKDVIPFTIVCGNPAKFVGYACVCGHKLDNYYRCSCGRQYTLEATKLKLTKDL